MSPDPTGQAGPPSAEARPDAAPAGAADWAALGLLALVVAYRPMVSGVGYGLAQEAAFALALMAAALLWLGTWALRGRAVLAPACRPSGRFGPVSMAFAAFMACALASSVLAPCKSAAATWWLLFATYGLTGLVVYHASANPLVRRFLTSCVLATVAALAAYALWHYVLYAPALRRWLDAEPQAFQAALNAAGPLAQDLRGRVTADRAYGSFLTANQLAAFLVLAIFPLAGAAGRLLRWWQRRGAAGLIAVVVAGACVAAAGAALCLSRSKGGWIAFLFGLALLGVGWLRRLRRPARRRAAALAVAALAALLIGAHLAGAMPGGRQFGRSLGVRLGYWRTSLRMVARQPLLGAGPGSWSDQYAMLKEPEYEETRDPHSLYVQLWAETGTLGLLAWLATCGAGLALVLRSSGREGEFQREGRPGSAVGLEATGLVVIAAALAFDYVLMGTFLPPRHVAAWLEGAPWLPYAAVYAAWAGAFLAFFRGSRGRSPVALWAGVAGLAALLLHSAAELTVNVPAVGGTAAVLAALVAAEARAPRHAGAAPRHAGAGARRRAWLAALACGAVGVVLWGALVARPALEASLSARAAEALEAELRMQWAASPGTGAGPAAAERARQVTAEWRRACALAPWDEANWRRLGAWLLWLNQAGLAPDVAPEAAEAFERATALRPLHAASWALLGRARASAGDAAGAVQAYRRAAELQPTLPIAWYRLGIGLEGSGAPPEEASRAYARALELIPRQYHRRNRVLGPPVELAAFWTRLTGERPGSVLELAADLASRGGGLKLESGATEQDAVRRLTAGLEGGEKLAGRWDSLDASARQRQLWQVAAGRLWEWALQARLAAAAGPE